MEVPDGTTSLPNIEGAASSFGTKWLDVYFCVLSTNIFLSFQTQFHKYISLKTKSEVLFLLALY